MVTSSKGRTGPAARKTSAKTSAKTGAKTSTAASKPTRLPAAASAASAAVKPQGLAVSVGVGPALPLRPPLEAALDAFSRELRAALDRATADGAALRAEITTLRAELTQLRQRYESHKHSYEMAAWGGGGHCWIELRFLQKYIDEEQPGFEKYGIWSHGKSTSDASPSKKTSGPSA